MNNKVKLIITVLIVSLIIAVTGCSHREAATVGAMIGHRIGTVFGTATVAVEETFETTKDVQAANPRWDDHPRHSQRTRHRPVPPPPHSDSESHYYSTNVVIKTRGPAEILSVEASETEDVTQFWGQ